MEVLELFRSIKKAAIEKVGSDKIWDYKDKTCIDYWCEICPEFNQFFFPLVRTEYKNLLLLRYNEEAAYDDGYSSPEDFWNAYDGLYRECRSVVIDKVNECCVLMPFRKFFNMNQIEETSEANVRARIDAAKNVEFSNKLDGSMQSARWYNGEAVMAGSQALDPDLSFRLKFGYEMLTDNYVDMLRNNPDKTFIFEFIHPSDVHVVRYSAAQTGLYLIGVREMDSGREWSYADVLNIAHKYGVLTTEVYNRTLDQVISELDDKRSDEAEGFVINIDGYKVKLKYNDYVQIHKILNKFISPNAIIRAVHDGKWDDLRAKLPESYKIDADEVAKKVFHYVSVMTQKLNQVYDDCVKNCDMNDKKQVFLYAQEHYGKFAHFIMTKINGREINFLHNGSGRFVKLKDIEKVLND